MQKLFGKRIFKVRQFSDLQLIEGIEQELMMKKNNKKVLEKENVMKKMKCNIKSKILVNFDFNSLNESYELPVNELFEKVEEYTQKIKQKKVEILYYYGIVGAFLDNIKNQCQTKIDFKMALESHNCSHSLSNAYFIIQIYNLLTTYPKLQYCAISMHYLRAHWKIIQVILKEDEEFWQ